MNEKQGSYPKWFQDCLAMEGETGTVEVEACSINFEAWGDVGKPGIVLIHGSNAHLEWWRGIAPLLSDQFRVVAMDSGGSGNSGWRKQYTSELFAKEVMAVASAASLGKNPYIVGHSFGGMVTLEVGHLFGGQLGGIIMLDFTITPPAEMEKMREFRKQRLSEPARPTKVYQDKAEALGRFRLVPTQPCKNSFFVDYLSEHSLREVNSGWTWKFDPDMFRNLSTEDLVQPTDKLLNLDCRSAFVLAEQSLDYSSDSLEHTKRIAGSGIPIFDVPGTYHHLMFDEPFALTMAIKGLLTAWDQS